MRTIDRLVTDWQEAMGIRDKAQEKLSAAQKEYDNTILREVTAKKAVRHYVQKLSKGAQID